MANTHQCAGGRGLPVSLASLSIESNTNMSETIQITLGGSTYSVDPFTVGQLADLHISSNEPQGDISSPEGAKAFWSRNIGILSVALKKTRDEISGMRLGTMTDISKAIMTIMVFSGIWTRSTDETAKKEGAPGEAPAA